MSFLNPDAPALLDFSPPSVTTLERLTAAQRAYFRPTYFGLENLEPDSPTLLVGNHTLFGLLDAPLLVAEIYARRGIYVRSLGDRFHFILPPWKRLMERFGVVLGSRENCSRLMKAGHHVLVFPGGGREVAKRKGEAYELIWKERLGFARMAIDHGYSITPFGAVGAEECYDILLDADDMLMSPIGRLLGRGPLADLLREGDAVMPLVKGWGGTPLPKPQRFYFSVGKQIATEEYGDLGEVGIRALRDRVRAAVYDQIQRLEVERTQAR